MTEDIATLLADCKQRLKLSNMALAVAAERLRYFEEHIRKHIRANEAVIDRADAAIKAAQEACAN